MRRVMFRGKRLLSRLWGPRMVYGYVDARGVVLPHTRISNASHIFAEHRLQGADNVFIGHASAWAQQAVPMCWPNNFCWPAGKPWPSRNAIAHKHAPQDPAPLSAQQNTPAHASRWGIVCNTGYHPPANLAEPYGEGAILHRIPHLVCSAPALHVCQNAE